MDRSFRFAFFTLVILLLTAFLGISAQADIVSERQISSTSTVNWRITNDGTLILSPTNGESGRIGDKESGGGTFNTSDWPWYSYRDEIKSIKMEGTISTFPNRTFNNMFYDCDNLTNVDLSGLDLKVQGLNGMFADCSSLTEIELNLSFTDGKLNSMKDMFNGCTSLQKVTWNNTDPNWSTSPNGVQIQRMFTGCNNLESVTLTGLKFAGHKETKDLGLRDCVNLQELNLTDSVIFGMSGSNTDDFTNISDYRGFPLEGLWSYQESETSQDVKTMNSREVIDTIRYPNDGTQKGQFVPGIYKKVSNTSNDFASVPQTDYLIDNMSGSIPYLLIKNNQDEIIKFTIFPESNGSVRVTRENVTTGVTFPSVVVSSSNYDNRNFEEGNYIIQVDDQAGTVPWRFRIFTKGSDPADWKNAENNTYEYSNKKEDIVIVYPDAATDSTGGKHAVHVSINGISFHDTDLMPDTTSPDYPAGSGIANPWYEGNYVDNYVDQNCIHGYYDNGSWVPLKYWDSNGDLVDFPASKSYTRDDKIDDFTDPENKKYGKIPVGSVVRYLMSAEIGQLNFWNQIKKSTLERYEVDPEDSGNKISTNDLYSKGSGTWIDYAISIEGAPVGSTFLYAVDDLDLSHYETWIMDLADPKLDKKTGTIWIDESTGKAVGGGEGIILRDGNDLKTISLANYSGLRILDSYDTDGKEGTANYIVGTDYDPKSTFSRFYVRANAQGASYTWTTGTSAKTTMLKSFEGSTYLPVYVLVSAEKRMYEEDIPAGKYSDAFTFLLENTDDPSYSQEANNIEGTVTFSEMLPFSYSSTLGTQTYYYRVTEVNGSDPYIGYNIDHSTYYLRITIYPSENTSLQKGAKAVIAVAKTTGNKSVNEINNWQDVKTVYSSDAQPVYEYTATDGSRIQYYSKNASLGNYQYYAAYTGENLIVSDSFNPKPTDPSYCITDDGNEYPVYAYDDGDKKYFFYVKDGIFKYLDPAPENPTNNKVSVGTFLNDAGITIKKTWNDNENAAGKRPDSINIALLRDGDPFGTYTLTAPTWEKQISYAEAPRFSEDGDKYTYTVKEEGLPETWEYVREPSSPDAPFTVKNKYDPELITVSVERHWYDQNNRAGLRPERGLVIMTLYNEDTGDTIDQYEIDDYSTQPHVWNLPKYNADGTRIKYGVRQSGVPVEYKTDREMKEEANGKRYFIFRNTYNPPTISIIIKKLWEDDNDAEGFRPESVEFHVHADGHHLDGDEVFLSEENEWTVTVSDLLKAYGGKDIHYSVVEFMDDIEYQPVPSEEIRSDGSVIYYTYTNTLSPGETHVEVDMDWDDYNNQDGYRPEYAVVWLYANGQKTDRYVHLTGHEDFPAFFYHLPIYDEDGEKIIYSIQQDSIPEYTTTVNQVRSNAFHIINVHVPEKVTINVAKVWDDEQNENNQRPDHVIFRLHEDGIETKFVVLNEANGWASAFTDLPKRMRGRAVRYTVSEDRVDDYSAIYEGEGTENVTVTNEFTPGMTSVTLEKHWEDNDNEDNLRPESVTVHLLANGQPTGMSMVLNEENAWDGDFINLPEYDENDQLIRYTVQEDPVTGYTVTYSGSMNEGFVIINTHKGDLEVIYLSDEFGTILGIGSEQVSYGMSPSGTSHRANTGYTTLGWTANRDVLLRNGTFIPAGTYMTDEQIRQIIVTEDLVLTVHHQQKPDHDDFSPFIDRYYSSRFTFTKQWIGEHGDSIDWTLYAPDGSIAHKGFNKYVRNEDEWYYEAWFDDCTGYYLVEKVPAGFSVRYENIAPYEDVTDRCYRGGRIINYKPPKTGDSFNPVLWWTLSALALLGITCTALLSVRKRRRVK